MSQGGGFLIDPWRYGVPPNFGGKELAERMDRLEMHARHLDQKNRDLERMLAKVTSSLNDGPVAGSYFPMFFPIGTSATPLVAGAGQVRLALSSGSSTLALRPILLTAILGGAVPNSSAVLQVRYGDRTGAVVNLLTVNPQVSCDATGRQLPMYLDKRSDFATDVIADSSVHLSRVILDILLVTNNPLGLNVMLVCKQVSKIEPA